MGIKPVYKPPKVSRLDEHENVLGSVQQEKCDAGSGDAYGCSDGNNPGPTRVPYCSAGSEGQGL